MSFLYSPAQAADCSPRSTCWDSAPSAMSRSTGTAKRSSKPASATGCSTTPRSGMTLEHSTGNPGVDAWILSLRDSRVSRSPLPDNSKPKWTTAISGLRPFVSFEKSSPDGACWKTCPACCLPGMDISEPFSETWPKAGVMLGGKCYRQQSWERPICESGSGLLPTPRAEERQQRNSRDKYVALSKYVQMFPTPYGLSANQRQGDGEFGKAIRNWPTPQATDGSKAPKYHKGGNPSLPHAVKTMLTTPTADDTGHRKSQYAQGGTALSYQAGGQLNPRWVEWLMGWPIGWTDLEPLGMAKFQQWLQEHGSY